jgi:hypothetical protein
MSQHAHHGAAAALTKLGFNVGLYPYFPRTEEATPPTAKKPERDPWTKVRMMGPAVGATTGGVLGLVSALRNPRSIGKTLKHTLGGAGTGSLLGWAPDFYSTAYEA